VKRHTMLNIMVIAALLLSAVPLPALAAPVASVASSQPAQSADTPLKPIVSPAVAPANTDGMQPAPTVTSVPQGKGFSPDRPYNRQRLAPQGAAQPSGDAALQTQPGAVNMPAPLVNFEALNNISGYYPPDTDGEVGPNHYVQMVNVSMAVYDKSGNLLYGPFFPSALWPTGDICAGADDGDPVVVYDQLSDRWLVSQFKLPNYPNGPFYECIAVSKTGTPTNVPADWYPYTFLVSSSKMNDYPKISVWPDAYYMTANQFTAGAGNWGGVGVWAFDRAKMLTGQAATFQYLDLATTNPDLWGGMLPADLDGSNLPPAGSPAYFFEVDDNLASPPLGADAARMWKFHVDWTTPANSTFGLAGLPNAVLPVASFDFVPCVLANSRNCIPQQSSTQKLDAIGDRLMFRATYRNFGDHEAVLLNHTVLADGTDRAGIRWYEIRNPSTTPTIYQQGTYAPADGQYRWMGSMAMDHVGNVALGYSVSSSTLNPSIRYSGRLATDPLGTLPQAEANIITGSGAQTGTGARWGDYSAMSVDPVDDCTFWYTTEYIQTTGTAPWQTRVASFKFPNCALGPQGTLTGVVTNTATSAPIVGAAIQAVATVTQTGATSTAAGGTYSMLLLTGSYSVTASAFGFLPKTLNNVTISQGVTTTLNIGLDPAPSYVISGTVRDALAGWPLYAKIEIPGVPGGPIWTDPVTGFYSVTLPGGATYQFNVSAFSAGYTPATVNVGPVTANATVNVGLNADAVACVAPGYSLAVTGLLEQFSSNALPAGWSVASSGTCPWTFNDPGARGNLTGGTGGFAVADSDICGSGTTMSTTLTSASMNVSSLANVNLSFNYDYNNLATAEVAAVDVSADNGTTWSNVVTWNTDQRGPKLFSQDVTSLLSGATQAKLRFRYIAPGWDWWWEVDNAFVGEKKCLPSAGGLVVGNVTDANTALKLAGVAIDSPTSSTTTNADGYYTLFSPAGSRPITASLPNYKTEVVTTSVPLSGTVRQNFALGAGKLVVAPAAITASLSAGVSTTVPMTITNSGNLAASFELIELDKGGVPYGPFDKPTYVVKHFRQDGWKNGIGLGIPRPRAFPPYAAGNVIQSWTPTGVTGPWGVAYDYDDNTVWVSSPSAAWGGTNQIFEFTPAGTPSGRSQSYTWAPTNGPADAAYNKNTGTLWVMNINTGVANCIYEVDPATGPTGNKICPTGSTGFATSQRGLAYDPSTDTYYAGGWNDSMVYQFKSDGTLLNSKNVGLAVAGLAYNPTTQHLFVVDSATASKFYVLDTANDYAALGSFTATGFTGGAGLEIDCNGNLWAADQGTGKLFQIESGETADFCASDVPWLSTTPVTGTLASAAAQVVNVKLDGSAVQPGVYNAQLKVKNNTPYTVNNVPVKMTVTAPATWGKLTGNVSTQGYCDANPAILAGVTVTVQSAVTSWNLVTDASGQYNYWFDQSYSPVTITVNAAGYQLGQVTGVNIVGQATTTNDFSLRWLQPCLAINPSAIVATLSLGQSTTRPFRLTNAGAASTAYSMTEQYVSAPSMPVYQPTVIGTVPAAINGKGFSASAQVSSGTVNQAPILLAPTAISLTHSLSQQITAANSVSCNASGIHDDNHYIRVFDLPTFGISGGLNVTAIQVGIETAVAGTGSSQPAEVRLYTLSGSLLFANMTPIGTATVQVSNQSQTILNVPIAATVPAGSKLVVDFFTPSGAASGHSLFVGSNSLGQTAPTYIAASACSINEPTDVSTIGFAGMHLVMNVIAEGSAGSADVAWLSEVPVTGTVTADSYLNTTVGFDANVVAVPGTYKANVNVNSFDPKNPVRTANMTLNVTAPASWGVLTGTVNSLGYCDVNPAPASGARVILQAANGLTRTVTTGSDGTYTLWLNSLTNPYTLTATAPQHVGSAPVGGITVDQLGAVSAAPTVNLRSIEPCVNYAPTGLSVTVPWKGSASQTLTLTNTGGASSLFTVTEQAGGFNPLAPQANPYLVVNDDTSTTRAITTALTSLGYTYNVTTSSGYSSMSVAALTAYEAVLYAGNMSAGGTLLSKTTAYLDAGGRFLVTGNDFGYFNGASPLYQTYLEATYLADGGSQGTTTGADIMAGVNPDISSDPYPDSFSLRGPDAVGVFANNAPNTDWAGLRIMRNAYKAVYLSFRLYYAGGLAVGDPIETTIMQKALTWLAVPIPTDVVPWLSETPDAGTLAANTGNAPVTVGFNAADASITQPGTYYAKLNVKTDDAGLSSFLVPVTMTVVPTDTQGKLIGTVTSLGYCDVNPVPVNGASLIVQNSLGVTHTLTTNASGAYQEWLSAGVYTVTASATGHLPAVASGLVTGTMTTTLNLNLRLNQPCVGASPAAGLSANLAMGVSTTLPMSITNSGAYTLSLLLKEVNGGFVSAKPEATADVLVVNDGALNALATQAFTTALTALGYTYQVAASSSTTGVPVNLSFYKYVIWAGSPSTGAEATQLIAYMDAGGSVLVSDNDFGYSMGGTPLYSTYFESVYGTDSGSDGVITGTNVMSGIVTDISSDPYPDSFTISGANAVGIFYNKTPGTWAASAIQRNSYKAIYLAWDFNYTGSSAITDTAKVTVLQPAMTWLVPTDPVKWLAADVFSADVAPNGGSQAVNVTFNAGASDVTQPGTYMASLLAVSTDPVRPNLSVPVTMTVSAPANWGKLTGVVNGLAACDVNPTPMPNAVVYVESGSGMTWTLKTDANGVYKVWMPAASSPLTVTASNEAGYEAKTASGISVAAGVTTTYGFNLRAYLPCAGTYVPSPLTTVQSVNQLVTKTLTISNTGAGLMNWNFTERVPAASIVIPDDKPDAPATSKLKPSARPESSAGVSTASPSDTLLSEGFEGGVMPPAGWQTVSNSSSVRKWTLVNSTTNPAYVHTGSYAGWVNYDSSAAQDEWLISPAITVFGGGSTSVSFWADSDTAYPSATMTLYAIDAGGTFTDTLWDLVADENWATFVYRQVTKDLSAYQGKTIRLAWHYHGFDGESFALDDILVTGPVAGSCTPNALPWVSAVPVSGTTAAAGTSPVEVVFNSTGMAPGSYTGYLCLNTSDPSHAKIEIPVSTTISGNLTLVYHDVEDVIHAGETLFVAGDFNSWNATATQMSGNADNSVFTVTVPTNQTSLQLKYIVYTDTAHTGPANWNWLQSGNRTVVMTGTMTADHYRNVEPGYYVLQYPFATSTVVGVPTENIYGQVWADDLTQRSGAPRGLKAELGYGTAADATLWNWQTMPWDSQADNNDQFAGALTPNATGVYSYAVRFNGNWGVGNPNTHWSYGDKTWGTPFSTTEAGVLTVGERRGVSLSPSSAMLLGKKGTVVTHTVQITNTGSTTDTFNLTTAGNTWAVSLSATSFTLGAGQGATLYVYATVPPEVETSDTVTVKAVSAADAAKQATATLTTAVKYFINFMPLVRR